MPYWNAIQLKIDEMFNYDPSFLKLNTIAVIIKDLKNSTKELKKIKDWSLYKDKITKYIFKLNEGEVITIIFSFFNYFSILFLGRSRTRN